MSTPRSRQSGPRNGQPSIDDAGFDDDSLVPAGAGAGALAFGPGIPFGSSALDAKVLVLNKLYVAVRVISARRAFSMLCRDIAEVIDFEDGRYVSYPFTDWAELGEFQQEFDPAKYEWVKTVRMQIAVPRIIRLVGYDRLPAQVVKLNRRNLFARDRNQCQYCGKVFSTSELSIDHVLPRAQGGGESWENLVCSCVRCNARKGGRTPDQAHMHLIRKPVKPKRNPLISIRLGQERYHSWKAFLDEAYWNVELK